MFGKLRNNEKSHKYKHQSSSYYKCYTQRVRQANNKTTLGSYSRIHQKKIDHNHNQLSIIQSKTFLYEGECTKNQKTGQGIMILNNGTIIIGKWQKDLLSGRALIFTSFGGLIAANFLQGKLEGWAISQYKDNVVIATLYFQDKIDGQRIVYQANQKIWIASKYSQNGKFTKITHIQKGEKTFLPSFVDSQELQDFFNDFVNQKNYVGSMKEIKQIKILQKTLYIGFLNSNRLPQGLGVTFSDKQLYLGNYKSGYLNQFGRMIFTNGDIYQGYLLEGTFNGQGIYYNPVKNTTLYLNSSNNKQTQIIEQFEGYTLLQFQPKIGVKVSNNFNGLVGVGLWQLCEHIEKYYCQYYIQKVMLENNQLSVKSIVDSNEQNRQFIENFDESENQNKPSLKNAWSIPKMGWVEDQVQGFSENYDESFDKNNIIRNKRLNSEQFILSPKNTKKATIVSPKANNYQSIRIKQNQEPSESQSYHKHSPKTFQKHLMLNKYAKQSSENKNMMNNEYTRSLQIYNMKKPAFNNKQKKSPQLRKSAQSISPKGNFKKMTINIKQDKISSQYSINDQQNLSVNKQRQEFYNFSDSNNSNNCNADLNRNNVQNKQQDISSSSVSNMSNKMATMIKKSMIKKKKIFA